MNTSRLYDIQRPYFMEASLSSDFTPSGSAPSSFVTLTGMNETTFTSPFNYNNGDWGRLNSNKWACPKTGIYSIYAMVQFESNNDDVLRKAFILLNNHTTGTDLFYNIFDAYGSGGGDDVDNVPVTGNVIAYIQEDDEIRLRVKWELASGSIIIKAGGATAQHRTHLIIRRII